MAAEVVEIIVKLTDQVAPAARKITKELTAVQKAGRSLKKGVGAGVEVLSKIPAVAATAAAALAVAKKAFDFAQQGAQIQQMGQSWDFLMAKVGVSPKILNDLSRAARGTITDMDLMTSTATLLAGAGDELAKSMAEASPRLLEIAKAANKLNPSLGDTAFLYESIARGVKRASPLILDNLGITIKIGDAYEKFAKQLGVSAKELTAEQRQMAVLNATLEAGDNLISQVGGTVDSVTDSFAQLETAAGETANLFKGDLFNALGPIITNMAEGAMASIEYANAVELLGLSGFEAGRLIHDFDGTVEEAKESIIRMSVRMGDLEQASRSYSTAVRQMPPVKPEIVGQDEFKRELQTLQGVLSAWSQKAAQLAFVRAQISLFGAPDLAGLTTTGLGARTIRDDEGFEFQGRQDVTERGLALASGGRLSGVNLVGEQGPELVLGDLVIPADMTRRLMALGLKPGKKFGLGGAIGAGFVAPSIPDFSFANDPISDPSVRAGLNIPTGGGGIGGGGGGASSVVAAAVQASMAINQSAAQETAAIVSAAIAPQVAAQSQQILIMQARTAEAAARNESLLSRILDALITQGTADDTGDAMAEAIQFLDA